MTLPRSSLGLGRFGFRTHPALPRKRERELLASSHRKGRFIGVSRSQRADQMEALLRQADASLEKWLLGAKTRGAGILRHRVDDLQAGLKKLSAGLQQLEGERAVTKSDQPDRAQKVTPSKRRARPAAARKPSAPRKPKKAA
jgi:hypothetical protein